MNALADAEALVVDGVVHGSVGHGIFTIIFEKPRLERVFEPFIIKTGMDG
jgi:hypothetical protein